jgi:hypothetical protein
MIIHKHPIAMKNYESIGQHQQGMIVSRRLDFLHVIESPTPFRSEKDIAVNMMATVRKLASLPNQSYISAIGINIIKEYFMPVDPKNNPALRELSDTARKAIALAVEELDTGHCKTFSSIDELLEDLESD